MSSAREEPDKMQANQAPEPASDSDIIIFFKYVILYQVINNNNNNRVIHMLKINEWLNGSLNFFTITEKFPD